MESSGGFISYVDDRRNRVTDMGRKSLIESTVLKFVIIGTLPCQLYIIYYVLIRIQLA